MSVVPEPIVARERNTPISVFPVTPYEERSLKLSTNSTSSINSSLDTCQETPADGKKPHLEFAPNLEDPSKRLVNVNVYVSSIEYVTRLKYELRLQEKLFDDG